jgi:hypothetical protein
VDVESNYYALKVIPSLDLNFGIPQFKSLNFISTSLTHSLLSFSFLSLSLSLSLILSLFISLYESLHFSLYNYSVFFSLSDFFLKCFSLQNVILFFPTSYSFSFSNLSVFSALYQCYLSFCLYHSLLFFHVFLYFSFCKIQSMITVYSVTAIQLWLANNTRIQIVKRDRFTEILFHNSAILNCKCFDVICKF